MTSNDRDSDRMTELEFSMMHLQKDFESLNEVVLQNGKRMDELKSLIQRLSDRLDASLDPAEPRSLEDEKPPHY